MDTNKKLVDIIDDHYNLFSLNNVKIYNSLASKNISNENKLKLLEYSFSSLGNRVKKSQVKKHIEKFNESSEK